MRRRGDKKGRSYTDILALFKINRHEEQDESDGEQDGECSGGLT